MTTTNTTLRPPRPGIVLPTRETATPVGAQIDRIRRLEELAGRIATELRRERARLTRMTRYNPNKVRTAAIVPKGIDSAAVRAWAKTHGWPNLGDRGRIPAAAIATYLTAHPGGHP